MQLMCYWFCFLSCCFCICKHEGFSKSIVHEQSVVVTNVVSTQRMKGEKNLHFTAQIHRSSLAKQNLYQLQNRFYELPKEHSSAQRLQDPEK